MPERPWISVAEAAQMTGYARRTICHLLQTGKVEGEKPGRDWWVSRASLLAYVRSAPRRGRKPRAR